MKLTIIRTEPSDRKDKGTFGVLLVDGESFCVTLENPWLDNKKFESCIPDGIYPWKMAQTGKYGTTVLFEDVPNRTEVLIHWGNLIKNTEGCILVGREYGYLHGERAILDSKTAHDELMLRLKNIKNGIIEIKSV